MNNYEALETYMRLSNFAENWNMPEMNVYDEDYVPITTLGETLIKIRNSNDHFISEELFDEYMNDFRTN